MKNSVTHSKTACPLYVSLNLYFPQEIMHQGDVIFKFMMDVVDNLSEFNPIKYIAPRIDKQRNRWFRFSAETLKNLQAELAQELVYQIEINDNQSSESFEVDKWYTAPNRHGMRFVLSLGRKRPPRLNNIVPNLPLRGHLMVDWTRLGDDGKKRFFVLCKQFMSWLKPVYGDFYAAPNANMCFDHWLGVLGQWNDTPREDTNKERIYNPYTLWGVNDKHIFMVDRSPLDGEFFDTLVRDSYRGLFLNARHVALLGGAHAIRRRTSYDVVENLGNGLLLLLSNNPAEWSNRNMRTKMLQLEEFISPISLAAYEKQGYDYRMIEAKVKSFRKVMSNQR